MHLCVTEYDIAHGHRSSFAECPLALAARSLFPGAKSVLVCAGTIRIHWSRENRTDCYKMPKFVWAIYEHYDATGIMTPFEFELELEHQ